MAATWMLDPGIREETQQRVKEGSVNALNGGEDWREMRLLVPIASCSQAAAQTEYILLRGDSETKRAKTLSEDAKVSSHILSRPLRLRGGKIDTVRIDVLVPYEGQARLANRFAGGWTMWTMQAEALQNRYNSAWPERGFDAAGGPNARSMERKVRGDEADSGISS